MQRVGHDDLKKRVDDLGRQFEVCLERIIAAPATTAADVLLNLQLIERDPNLKEYLSGVAGRAILSATHDLARIELPRLGQITDAEARGASAKLSDLYGRLRELIALEGGADDENDRITDE